MQGNPRPIEFPLPSLLQKKHREILTTPFAGSAKRTIPSPLYTTIYHQIPSLFYHNGWQGLVC